MSLRVTDGIKCTAKDNADHTDFTGSMPNEIEVKSNDARACQRHKQNIHRKRVMLTGDISRRPNMRSSAYENTDITREWLFIFRCLLAETSKNKLNL